MAMAATLAARRNERVSRGAVVKALRITRRSSAGRTTLVRLRPPPAREREDQGALGRAPGAPHHGEDEKGADRGESEESGGVKIPGETRGHGPHPPVHESRGAEEPFRPPRRQEREDERGGESDGDD